MQRVAAIALNTFREAVRDRVLYNLIVFALLLMGTAILFGQISIGVERLIVVNLGLAAVTFYGLGLTLLVNTALMAVGFFLALWYVQRRISLPDPSLLAALYFIFLALLLATALALFFSCFSSPVLSAAFTFGLFIGGSLADDLRELGRMVELPWVKMAGDAVYYAVPNFRNFNVIAGVAQGHPVPAALLWQNTAYAALYIGLVLAASALIFQNRNLK